VLPIQGLGRELLQWVLWKMLDNLRNLCNNNPLLILSRPIDRLSKYPNLLPPSVGIPVLQAYKGHVLPLYMFY
jgi:hypothetical protein